MQVIEIPVLVFLISALLSVSGNFLKPYEKVRNVRISEERKLERDICLNGEFRKLCQNGAEKKDFVAWEKKCMDYWELDSIAIEQLFQDSKGAVFKCSWSDGKNKISVCSRSEKEFAK